MQITAVWLAPMLGSLREILRPGVLQGIVALSLLLNLWRIDWGLPDRWHPDEITQRAEHMAGSFSLNPDYFVYGSFHYYPIIALAVLPVKLTNRIFGVPATEKRIAGILSRMLSAVLGSGIVVVMYLLGQMLFNRVAGLIAAFLLTLTMGFVNISHFASTDIASLFWFSLSGLMAGYAFLYGSRRSHLLAGLFAGLAAAVKYVGGLALLALVCAHVLRYKEIRSILVLGILMGVFGFILGNPVVLFAFFEFAEGFLEEGAVNAARATDRPVAFLPLIGELENALGVPLFILSLFGCVYSFKLLGIRGWRRQALFVWSMLLPYYVLFGSRHVSTLRYVVPLVPFLHILTGKMMADLLVAKSRALRAASLMVLLLVAGYSLLYVVAADFEFSNDSRYLAARWIRENIPQGSKIEITSYGPPISRSAYVIIERPHDNRIDRAVSVAMDGNAYQVLYDGLRVLRSYLTGKSGDLYVPWYEKAIQRYQSEISAFDISIEGLESRAPDYLVVSELYFVRFSGERSSPEAHFFEALFSGQTGYREMAQFKYRLFTWLTPHVEFVNPRIHIFVRGR